jgi:POT family proton-dependent oligopeptide transporter
MADHIQNASARGHGGFQGKRPSSSISETSTQTSATTTLSPPPPPLPQQPKLNPTHTILNSNTGANSRPGSPTPSETSSEDLPNNVSTEEDLLGLPEECLSGEPATARPLLHITEFGSKTHHALQPMMYSVAFILIIELLERFAFYGINYTQTSFLTGVYDRYWNAGMESVTASTYVSISVAVAYTTPFLGAYMADSALGDYRSILVGSVCFYLPGLFLIAFTTIPGFLGQEFNRQALSFGLLFLWPVGTGIVKSCVNVFGARQFHPILQSSLIESYFVSFYMCINYGA